MDLILGFKVLLVLLLIGSSFFQNHQPLQKDQNKNYNRKVSNSIRAFKVMTYNIKESGVNPDWKEVVKEENPNILVMIETGDWDEDSGDGFSSDDFDNLVDELNGYFSNEDPYIGYTTQGIPYSTSGETILSRYPVISTNQISNVLLDNGFSYYVSHDFFDVIVNIDGIYVNIIAAHLKCCSGSANEEKREKAQEGIINYMDSLGSVPIMYVGDLNSFSPQDTGNLAPEGDLGYDPITMLVNSDDPHASTIHTWIDVYRLLNPTTPGHTYGHQNPIYSSRIDYIFVNQFFTKYLINSTTGDTSHASTGSDHYSVDVFLRSLSTSPSSSSEASTTQSTVKSSSSINGTHDNTSGWSLFFFAGIIVSILIKKRKFIKMTKNNKERI